MRITDYEQGRSLSDVAITLTSDEASELAAYLHRLIQHRELGHAHLSEVSGMKLERELTIAIVEGAADRGERLLLPRA